MKEKSFNKLLGNLLILLFFILLTLKDFLKISIPELAFTFVWLALLLIADQNTTAAFSLSVVICFASTISITIPIAFFIVKTIYKRFKYSKFNMLFYISCVVISIELFRFFIINEESFKQYVNIAVIVILVGIVINELYNKHCQPEKFLKYYIAFFVYLTIDIIWGTVKSLGSIGNIVKGGFRIGQVKFVDMDTVSLLAMNANGIALLAMLAVAIIILLLSKKKLKIMNAIGLIIYATFIGFLTASKTFVLVYLGFWTVFILWYIRKNNRHIIRPIALLLVVALFLFIISKTNLVQNVINRFFVGDFTTGRLEISTSYLRYIMDHPSNLLFGIGLQNVTIKTGIISVPHNAILEIFVCLGIIGLIAYFIFFISYIKLGIKYIEKNAKNSHYLINYIPFIVYFVFIQSLQFLRISYIYSSLALVFACMIVLSDNEKINKTEVEYEI